MSHVRIDSHLEMAALRFREDAGLISAEDAARERVQITADRLLSATPPRQPDSSLLTACLDVATDRFEIEIVGWDRRGVAWLTATPRAGQPSSPAA